MRINLDSVLFGDPRLLRLAKVIEADKFEALGRLLYIWHYAYCQERDVLTEDELSLHGELRGSDLIAAQLGESHADGIRLRGIRDRIGWIQKKRESASRGGKASVKSRELKHPATRAQAPVNTSSSSCNPLSPALSPALALSLSSPNGEDLTSPDGEVCRRALPDDSPKVPAAQKLVELWNRQRHPSMPAVETLSPGRRRHALARLRDKPELEYWEGVIRRIAASSFCRGQNDRSWRATFDWLLRPDTHAKALEGRYDDQGASETGGINWDEVWAEAARIEAAKRAQ